MAGTDDVLINVSPHTVMRALVETHGMRALVEGTRSLMIHTIIKLPKDQAMEAVEAIELLDGVAGRFDSSRKTDAGGPAGGE